MTRIAETPEIRLNVRLAGPLADHVNHRVESNRFNTHSEYIRDLVRRDMDSENAELRRRLIEGYSQLAAGNFREVSADELFNKAMDRLRAEGMEIGDDEYIK